MPPFSSERFAARLERTRAAASEAGVSGLVVSHQPNVFYLSGLAASSAFLLVTASRLYLLTDFRYSAAVASLLASTSAPPDTSFVRVEGSYEEALSALLASGAAGERVGFEAGTMTVRQHQWLTSRLAGAAGPAVTLVPTEGVVERLRAVKDADELAVMREAGARLSAVAADTLRDVVRAGRSEDEMAADIDARVRAAGFSRTAFDTIVATGPQSALPHAHPGPRRAETGELVLVDFGGVLDGYCVDLTRTTVVGRPSADARRLYRAVAEAQDAAIAAVRAGVAADVVDATAREALARHGLADAFGHSTGHGLGLEVHEEPRVGRRRADGAEPWLLEAGMVVTVEPGAYVDGFGGVRLEDDVIVTGTGAELITDVPRDSRLLGG
jgi:Xaa-Pro aminopeptidase